MSISKASGSTRSLRTTNTVRSSIARLHIWVGRMTRLQMTVESPWSGTLCTEFDKNVRIRIASEGRFALPKAMLLVDIVATVGTTPGSRAPSVFDLLDADLHATSNKGAVRRIFVANIMVAVDGAQIIPKVVLAWLEVVLNLDNTSRSYLILGDIAKLDGNATMHRLAIVHTVNSDRVCRDCDSFVISAFKTRASGADSPGVHIVGTVIDELEVVVRRDQTG